MFRRAMKEIAKFALIGKYGNRFRQMISEYGAVEAANSLLVSKEIQTGLMKLWEINALDKSMEALVVQDRFQSLFTQAEIDEAHRRLDQLGFFRKE